MSEESSEEIVATSQHLAHPIVEKVVNNVPHITQIHTWDCGITCIRMVLTPEQSKLLYENLHLYCTEELQNQSTWTIDLCYILNHFSVKLKYFTKTLGINPSFACEKFYDGYISKDEARVNERFKNAKINGITVHSSTILLEDLLTHLQNNGLAIVLTNANLLDCQHCSSLMSGLNHKVKMFLMPRYTYSGHYIVACGYDRVKNIIFYKDPAVKSAFEKARKAHGTDEDLIFIYRP